MYALQKYYTKQTINVCKIQLFSEKENAHLNHKVSKKKWKQTNIGTDMVIEEHYSVNCYNNFKKLLGSIGSPKLNICRLYDPAISLLDIYSPYTHIHMFTKKQLQHYLYRHYL